MESPQSVIGRFAPSPTGRMHAGNIFSYLIAWMVSRSQGGSIVLRIEDLDVQRSKPPFVSWLLRDLEALGLTWDEGPYFQQGREEAYAHALESLRSKARLYPCFCTRADLHAASAPHEGESPIYPGTCRHLSPIAQQERSEDLASQGRSPSWRLELPDRDISIDDEFQGSHVANLAKDCGDIVLRRADGAFAYQLAVVVDDAAQGVNSVVRGVDLLPSAPAQRFLQGLLGYAQPAYGHVPLLVAADGRRLSKRDHDAGLDAMLRRFETPAGIIGHIAFLAGLLEDDEPCTPEELLRVHTLQSLTDALDGKKAITWS